MNNSKVKVTVRVRPLNQREEELNSECVVQVSGNQITLLPPISCKEKDRKEPHIFTYDNCFWTKDKYDTGQEDIFEHLGDGVLENIWCGYNVCIFAYGQTGSGKTFSMMGTEDQPGIVPRICSALFNKETSDLEAIRIEASYFEIYNEEVRDLLRLEKKQTRLRVREDRLLGPYVEELSCHAVQSYEEIKLLLDQGNKQRAMAETKMNEQSSRSHAILALTVTQTCHKMSHDHKSGASRDLVSKVSLVDLAGSERSYKSGAQGSQLKECCNINKSLLTLGLVINSLAEISENKRKSQHVNYRDSVLTWLLKNNLGGNSKTIMLATVSPAADNYQETLSTLRYADSAKRIVNQAVINEDVKSKAIEELQEEIKKLREQLTTIEHMKEAEVQKLKSQLEEKENLLNVLETSWEEKLKRTEVATKEWQKNLENMGVILKKQNVTFSNECYLIQRGTSLIIHNMNDITKIGSGPSQDIQISGPEAECEHCVIRKTEEGEVFLIAVNNSKIYVNGCLSKTKTQLWHEDKIHVGTNVFDLHQPSRPKPEYMKTNVSSEAEAQTYDELNTEKGRSSILSEREDWNCNMIENEKSKTKSAFYKKTESSAPTIPASDDDLNSSEKKQTSDMFTQISNESNSQPIDMKVNTAKSEYLEIGVGREVQDFMVPCSPQYGEATSQTSEILGNNNCLQSTQDLEDHANLPRKLELSREKKQLQTTRRQDTSHPSPDVEMEEPNILPSGIIPDDSRVTSQHHTCEENPNEKTEEVPHQQSITDTYKASSPDSVLPQECEFSSEKPKAEPVLNTSSKIEMQNGKGLCDSGREGDKEVASDGLQRTCRQDMSHPSPDDEKEEYNIPADKKILDDTSQNDTCEENQNEKTEEVPHQQSNTDTYKARPHVTVLHQESNYSSEKPKAEPDLNTSLKKEPPQNDKGHGDLDGESDTEMSSDEDFVDCSPEFILDEEHTSCESTIQLQNAAKDSTDHKEPAIDSNTLSWETSTNSVFSNESRKEIKNEKEILFKELLEKMKIGTKQTSKLTLQKVLEIGPESLMTDEPSDDNVLWYFVRRLMSLNGDARNINKLFIKSEESESKKDDSLIFLVENELQNDIHPLDVVSAAFHCSDHFLQQEIISKMSMCQFAVPLLLPDIDGPECTFMLWAMRGIVKKWRPQSLADSKGFMEDSLVNVQMPTISFVRLGNCRLSKSKILNLLLGTSQHQHEHFIHRDMEGGNAARKISDGLVEISWYFPGGKGKFPEPLAFTNLRGKLESNVKKFDFLTEISSVVVILTEGVSKDQYELLMKYNSHNTKYLLIISPDDTRMMEDTEERLKLLAPVLNLTQDNILSIPRNANETTAVSKLYSSLLSIVQNNIKTLSLETLAKQTPRHGIRIDEDFEECQKAQLRAKEITDEIEDLEKYKKETMKLQAKPLKEMAKLEKEMCQMKRQGNSNGEKYKSDLRRKCEVIRQEQWKCDIPSGISKFVNAITSINASEKFYFLQWLKFHLDVEARKYLYPLQAQYKKTCNLPDKQAGLTKLDQRISDSSLGIEHFLREVGQLYEAWHDMGRRGKSKTINFESLPRIAADLLLDGFPLELIDGDASRIPLQWIKDVLCELNKKIKGQNRLKVITVLGVQSTGKSTLLNTMFGLQFPVSSGRCTRGAFMTLLKVKENFQSYFMCQFILVIDTEGLKAPELDALEGSYEHDNELATLVIGLSDITLINMAMENTTEMKDILQIVIHAFLRMKQIGKKPNCQFVHQNVSDVSAPSMNMRGRKKLMDQLDEMTRTVAAMENKTQFKSFSDIMEYDLEHDNCYIAGLWHGVPPMASVNSAYSENVNELKQKLLKIIRDRHNKTQNINEFISWVSDLWNAVKHENFIFSFRNSLIAKAYNQLSIKYSEREWKFSKLMCEWLTKSETLIKNQPSETLEAKVNECKKEAECILTKEGKEILAWLEEYFSKETDGAQLIKYKTDFEFSAQNLRKSLETSSITKLNETIQIQRDNIRVQDVYNQQIEKIEQQVSNFIEECRQKKHEPNNAELEKELERIWNNAAKNLKVSNRKVRDIEGEMLLVLSNDMKERGSGVNEKIQKTKHFPKPKKQQDPSFVYQALTSLSYQYKKWKGDFKYEDFFQNVLHKCINYSGKQTQKGSDYDDTYCREILKIIDENCKNDDAKNYFSADREFNLKLAILGHILDDFQKMHFNFLQKNDPHARLNSLKPVYFDTFKNAFQKKNESKSLAERVCKNLFKPSLTDHINRKLGIEVVDDIANSKGSEKYSSRMFFQFTVLENLLEEDNFKNYVNYSNDYKNFVKSWITNYIVKEYKNISTLQDSILSDIMGRVRSSLNNPPVLNLNYVSDFLSHLCEKLNSDLVLPQQTMKAIIFKNSATIEDFIDYMRISLTDTEEEIRAELKSLSTEDVLSRLEVKPQDELFKKVFGCGKQCPFCKVPCEAGGTDHKEHFASVHRPEGLGQYRWSTTKVLCHDICTTSVVGNTRFKNELTEWKPHPYKDYRDFYPDWKIQSDESIEASDYWKFILKEYNKQFAAEYRAKPADYPEEWNSLTREMAKKSLQKTFNM